VPVCGVVDELLPEVVLPGVVVVLGWPAPGALAAFGPMPAAPDVPEEDDVPADVPVLPVCDELFVSADGEPDDDVPLVPVPLVPLVPEVVVELLPELAASVPEVLAVEDVPVPVSDAVSLLRWQAPRAAAATSERTRLRAMEEVAVMSSSLRIGSECFPGQMPCLGKPAMALRLPNRARPDRQSWRTERRRKTPAHEAVTY